MEGTDTHSIDTASLDTSSLDTSTLETPPFGDDPGAGEPVVAARAEEARAFAGNGASPEAALSTTPVENDFVTGVYQRLATVYDWVFGPILHHGRVEAIQRMDLQPGARVLEVGVGTGITTSIYPGHCQVTGIDFSAEMLKKARERVKRKGLDHVRLLQMDAAHLDFPDDTFDVVHAAYVMSVVADPVRVAREMVRVCSPGGRVIFLNHFKSPNALMAALERRISPVTVHIGFKADLDLRGFLQRAGLEPESVEKVNFPRLWSLVTCVKA